MVKIATISIFTGFDIERKKKKSDGAVFIEAPTLSQEDQDFLRS